MEVRFDDAEDGVGEAEELVEAVVFQEWRTHAVDLVFLLDCDAELVGVLVSTSW